MPLLEADQIERTRNLLRHWPQPFLLRGYEATPDDYEAIDDEDFKCEFLDGVLIVHSAASIEHERVTAFLVGVLADFDSRNNLGTVLGSNAVMQLGQRRFSPDVSFLSVKSEGRVRGGRVHGPMDLVVEVLSSSTRAYDRGEKLTGYQQGEVPEIWHVDPDERRFETWVRRGGAYDRRALDKGRWESFAIPGLSVEVGWFWRRPLPSLDDCRSMAG